MSYIKKYDDVSDNIEYWSVSMILSQLKNVNTEVPYQRNTIWTVKQQQYFIDSIINGFSVFPVVFNVVDNKKYNNEYDKGYKWNCVDGKQRLNAIKCFAEGKFSIEVRLDPDTSKMVKYSDIKEKFDDERPMPIRIYKGLDKLGECGVFDRLQNGLSCTKGERVNAIENIFMKFIKTEVVKQYADIFAKLNNIPTEKRKNNIKKWIEMYAVCIDNIKQSWTVEQFKSYCDLKTDRSDFDKFIKLLDKIKQPISKMKNKINTMTLEICLIRAGYDIETDEKQITIIDKRVYDFNLNGNGWNKVKKENFNLLSTELNKYDWYENKDNLYQLILKNDIDNYLKEINTINI